MKGNNIMQTIRNGKEKQTAYAHEYRRLKKAFDEEFYLEAIAISYAVIEDRLVSFLHHAGIVSRQNEKLSINGPVSPFVHKLLNKKNNEAIRIKDISVKIAIIQGLIHMTKERAVEIDFAVSNDVDKKGPRYLAQHGYMVTLQEQIVRTVDANAVQDIFGKIEPWRDVRNQLIHALLNKTESSSTEARKECAQNGLILSRSIDNTLVRPFKKDNRIRKKYNIQ